MLSILIRIFAIYVLIGFVRNLWKAYKVHSALKNHNRNKSGHEDNIVDAEFRELKDDEL